MSGMGLGLDMGCGAGGGNRYGISGFGILDEYTTARAAGAVNGTACEPGVDTRTVVDTENCITSIPNLSSVIANQTGLTFGAAYNRWSFVADAAFFEVVGFDASVHAGQGRIIIITDSVGRSAVGFIGAAGTGETLGDELVTSWTNATSNPFETFVSSGSAISSALNTSAAGRAAVGAATPLAAYKAVCNVSYTVSGSLNLALGTTPTNFSFTSLIGVMPEGAATIYISPYTDKPVIGIYTTSPTINFSLSMSIKQVLTPSAAGVQIYKDAACTVPGWLGVPTGFNPNGTAFTFSIHDPLSGGKMFYMGGKPTAAYGDPGDWIATPITRAPGVMGACKILLGDATSGFEFGFSNAKTGALVGNSFRTISDAVKAYDGSTAGPTILIPTDSTEITKAVILRAAGAFFFRKLSTGYWKLVWSTSTNNTATLYLGVAGYSMSFTKDWMRKLFLKWLPTPVLSDGFTAADATSNDGRLSDGLGHAEGVAGGIGSGGGGVAWSGSSGAIQSNRLVITPSLGSESLTDSGFESWISNTNLTSWSETLDGETISKEATVIHGGTYAVKVAFDATPGTPYINTFSGIPFNSLGAGAWYKASVWAKKSGTNPASVNFGEGGAAQTANMGIANTLSTDYTLFSRTGKKNIAIQGFVVYSETRPASESVYYDDASAKQITLSTCFATTSKPTTADITMECSFTMVAGLQAGLVFGLNEAGTSFILAYHDGAGNIKLEICEAGTWTTKASVAAAYSPDATLRVRRDGVEIWAWYGGTLIGTGPTTTLSAGENTNLRGTKAGLFSTDSANSFNYCTIYYTGSNGEHSVLNGIIGE